MKKKKLADLLPLESPEAVLQEASLILQMMTPGFPLNPITHAFNTLVKVFKGRYPGYRACNTHYHDLHHTLDAFLAMTRLTHGATLNGEVFKEREIHVAMTAVLFHDVGYIQEKHDTQGTGAKHSDVHVSRSMDFLSRHGDALGLTPLEIKDGRAMILCTDLQQEIRHIRFRSATLELLGRMVNAADLLAQLAGRTYLEKLLFLYHELREANAISYGSALDLIKMTDQFYKAVDGRLQKIAEKTDLFFKAHFKARWRIHENLYQETIDRQKEYLARAIKDPHFQPDDHFKRRGSKTLAKTTGAR